MTLILILLGETEQFKQIDLHDYIHFSHSIFELQSSFVFLLLIKIGRVTPIALQIQLIGKEKYEIFNEDKEIRILSLAHVCKKHQELIQTSKGFKLNFCY